MPIVVPGGGGGGSPAALTLIGPVEILETDSEITVWTPAVGDVLVDIWLIVRTSFVSVGAEIEIYTGSADLLKAGSTNPLHVSIATEDGTRRYPLADWRASTYISADSNTVPTVFTAPDPVLADVLVGTGGGVADIYALVSTPA